MRVTYEQEIPWISKACMTKRWALDQLQANRKGKYGSVFRFRQTVREANEDNEVPKYWDVDSPTFGDCLPPEGASPELVSEFNGYIWSTFFGAAMYQCTQKIAKTDMRDKLLEMCKAVASQNTVAEEKEIEGRIFDSVQPILWSARGIAGTICPEMGEAECTQEHIWYCMPEPTSATELKSKKRKDTKLQGTVKEAGAFCKEIKNSTDWMELIQDVSDHASAHEEHTPKYIRLKKQLSDLSETYFVAGDDQRGELSGELAEALSEFLAGVQLWRDQCRASSYTGLNDIIEDLLSRRLDEMKGSYVPKDVDQLRGMKDIAEHLHASQLRARISTALFSIEDSEATASLSKYREEGMTEAKNILAALGKLRKNEHLKKDECVAELLVSSMVQWPEALVTLCRSQHATKAEGAKLIAYGNLVKACPEFQARSMRSQQVWTAGINDIETLTNVVVEIRELLPKLKSARHAEEEHCKEKSVLFSLMQAIEHFEKHKRLPAKIEVDAYKKFAHSMVEIGTKVVNGDNTMGAKKLLQNWIAQMLKYEASAGDKFLQGAQPIASGLPRSSRTTQPSWKSKLASDAGRDAVLKAYNAFLKDCDGEGIDDNLKELWKVARVPCHIYLLLVLTLFS